MRSSILFYIDHSYVQDSLMFFTRLIARRPLYFAHLNTTELLDIRTRTALAALLCRIRTFFRSFFWVLFHLFLTLLLPLSLELAHLLRW